MIAITLAVMRRHSFTLWSSRLVSCSQVLAVSGMIVTATRVDTITAMAIVMARSANSWPSTSRMNKTGRKMATVVAVDASSAPQTWREPCREASVAGRPFSRRRTMFSSTTIAASITMPTAKANPAKEMTFRLRPAAFNMMNVASREMGMAAAMMSVALTRRRNHHSTPTARNIPRKILPETREMAR